MSRWRPALRIARRTVTRSRGRSLLIAILVGLPVAGATYADVIARTFSSPERAARHLIGSADAAVTVTPGTRLRRYSPRWLQEMGEVDGHRDPAKVDVAALLPAGTHIVRMPRTESLTLVRAAGVALTPLLVGDVREPMHRYAMRLDDGRAPGLAEVLVSPRLAKRLKLLDDDRLRPGATITLVHGPNALVSGLVRDPSCLSCELAAALPGSTVARAATAHLPRGQHETGDPSYLVDLPAGTDANALGRHLAARGIALTTHEALVHPDRYAYEGETSTVTVDSLRTLALVALIVGLGLLEVVLLAGTAFAVGARRQTRELGLVAASGGSPRDIRRIVLAQGLVLGAVGAALGVAAGFAVAIGGRPFWERLADSEIDGWAFGPPEIAVAALVGLLSGLAAAVLPALGAGRMRPVNALAGRFRTGSRTRRRGTVAGVALLVVGAACGLLGDHQLADGFAAYVRDLAEVQRSGGYVEVPSPNGPVALVVGGATLALVGLVMLAPALIGALARAGARLPLSARLAVRDAERHRHRTGPATSAIVVAVSGSVVLAFTLAGTLRADELRYPPQLPAHMLSVTRGDSSTTGMLHAARLTAAQLPGGRRHPVATPFRAVPKRLPRGVQYATGELYVDAQPRGCPSETGSGGCGSYVELGRTGGVAIGGDDATTRLLAGPGFDAAARTALAEGKALVFSRGMLDSAGKVHVGDDVSDRIIRVPGHVVRSEKAYAALPAALVSRRTARARGWRVRTQLVLVTYCEHATRDDVDTAVTAAVDAGAGVAEDRGTQAPKHLALLLIGLAAAFVTLVGVAISVALSAAEGRADLATLAAVGAPPSRRRALMASQALLVGGRGCVLGVGLGTFISFTARTTTGSPDFVVPWANLAATGIGVPLLAALVAALCSRGRPPLVRRTE
jgi:putative ABC transport system permease protein